MTRLGRRLAPLLALGLAALSGCGGMTRTIGVLPAAADDLARRSEPFRAGRENAEAEADPAARRAEGPRGPRPDA